jgi:hypothetical protein
MKVVRELFIPALICLIVCFLSTVRWSLETIRLCTLAQSEIKLLSRNEGKAVQVVNQFLVGSYTNSPNTVRNPLEADDAVLYTI